MGWRRWVGGVTVAAGIGFGGGAPAKAAAAQIPSFAFETCAVGALKARCGSVSVPENRALPGGRTIDLFVTVIPASPVAQPDPVVVLVGGPGQSAARASQGLAAALRPIFPDRDLIFADQRGSGRSNGLYCAEDTTSVVTDPALLESLFPVPALRQCLDRLRRGADLAQYATWDAADDLADVVRALGYAEVNLVGLSYGTRLAQVLARRHPQVVRTMALAGVVSMDQHPPFSYSADAQAAWDRFRALCAAHAACRAAYPALDEDLAEVFRRLDADPVRVAAEHPRVASGVELVLTRDHAAYAVRGLLYTVRGQDGLPGTIAAALAGDWRPLASAYVERRLRGFATGLYLSVMCSEEVRPGGDGVVSSHGFLGSYVVDQMRPICAEWPASAVPPGYHEPVISGVPVLLVSGELDPATPPSRARAAAEGFAKVTSLVVPSGGHGVTESRNGARCLGAALATFVATADVTAVDARCLDGVPGPSFGLRESSR